MEEARSIKNPHSSSSKLQASRLISKAAPQLQAGLALAADAATRKGFGLEKGKKLGASINITVLRPGCLIFLEPREATANAAANARLSAPAFCWLTTEHILAVWAVCWNNLCAYLGD